MVLGLDLAARVAAQCRRGDLDLVVAHKKHKQKVMTMVTSPRQILLHNIEGDMR